jgi:hypothetical protein
MHNLLTRDNRKLLNIKPSGRNGTIFGKLSIKHSPSTLSNFLSKPTTITRHDLYRSPSTLSLFVQTTLLGLLLNEFGLAMHASLRNCYIPFLLRHWFAWGDLSMAV